MLFLFHVMRDKERIETSHLHISTFQRMRKHAKENYKITYISKNYILFFFFIIHRY